jgi:hypothetical protein
MRRLFLLWLSFVGFLLAASPANAAPPEREDVEVFHYSASQDCGSFTNDYQGTVTVRLTFFLNSEGEPITEHKRVMLRETDTNSVTGKTILVRQSYTEIADLRTDIARYVGQVFMGIGKGAHVIHDTGLWVFNADGVIRFAGPHTVLQNGDEVFCQALR